MARQVVLDTETTGLEPKHGHRIIEIGCVEVINRRITRNHFHYYIRPDREVDEGAFAVHGISNEFLLDKPRFEEIAEEFVNFIKDAELIIHNAPFDVGFIDHEFRLLKQNHGIDFGTTLDHATVLDSLVMARRMHPGQKNNLDALCKRYDVNNDKRELHGALLDAEILADVYMAMTGGQSALMLDAEEKNEDAQQASDTSVIKRLDSVAGKLRVVKASDDEIKAHDDYLNGLGEAGLWGKEPVSQSPAES